MIKFENTEVVGFEHAIRGMRNPMNSWDRIDSGECSDFGKVPITSCREGDCMFYDTPMCQGAKTFIIGENDMNLMKRLRKAGTDHRKYLRMITVYVDITAPLYWWKEFDTYKVGTVANSCSTMHKIHAKEFTLDDFSCEHLGYLDKCTKTQKGVCIEGFNYKTVLRNTIVALNYAREMYLETKDKKYWWQMIQLLPSSYNQKRTVMLNYEVLNNIYKSRKHHKLDEWSIGFIKWIESLQYAKELIADGESI